MHFEEARHASLKIYAVNTICMHAITYIYHVIYNQFTFLQAIFQRREKSVQFQNNFMWFRFISKWKAIEKKHKTLENHCVREKKSELSYVQLKVYCGVCALTVAFRSGAEYFVCRSIGGIFILSVTRFLPGSVEFIFSLRCSCPLNLSSILSILYSEFRDSSAGNFTLFIHKMNEFISAHTFLSILGQFSFIHCSGLRLSLSLSLTVDSVFWFAER